MKGMVMAILLATLLAFAACGQQMVGEQTNETVMTAADELPAEQETAPLETPAETEPADDASLANAYSITKTEGDLVILSPEAIDPDGDAISYAYSAPFDKNGRWQTSFGDAGKHPITVTASDTKGGSTAETVLVIITKANRPPVLDCAETIVVKEGEIVKIDCKVSDEEKDDVSLSFDGWMTSKSYQTTFEDAGMHEVTVTADDKHNHKATEKVNVNVQNVNRVPVFPLDFPSKITAEEGDIVTINSGEVTDPDGDKVTFTFGKPFDEKGVWRTQMGDAGEYPVDVVVSDGTTTVKKTVRVVIGMKNTVPVLKRIPDITAYEGDTIKLSLQATDREDDKLTYTVSGWMTTAEYTTTYDDAGTYTTKVTVSDGQFEDSQVVHITVLDRNRPPVFKVPA